MAALPPSPTTATSLTALPLSSQTTFVLPPFPAATSQALAEQIKEISNPNVLEYLFQNVTGKCVSDFALDSISIPIHHRQWNQVYNRVETLISSSSAKSAKTLKFFLVQYLVRIETYVSFDSVTKHIPASPLQGNSTTVYHRDYKETSHLLNLLNKILSQLLKQDHVVAVSDLEGFISQFKSQFTHVCEIDINDTPDVIKGKIRKAFSKKSSVVNKLILVNLGARKSEELNKENSTQKSDFLTCIKTALTSLKESPNEFNTYAYGSLDGQSFIALCPFVNQSLERINNSINEIKHLCATFGFTPSIQETARFLAQRPLESLVDSSLLTTIPNDSEVNNESPTSFEKLLSHEVFLKFSHFAKNCEQNSAVEILSTSILQFLGGFKKYQPDKIFASLEMSHFLKHSYAKILDCMEKIMQLDFSNDPEAYLKLSIQKDLIFEEALFWLEHCANKEVMEKELKGLLFQPVGNSALKPAAAVLTANGMKNFTLLRNACMALKNSSSLNVMRFNDTYFEIIATSALGKDKVVYPPFDDKDLKKALAQQANKEKIDLVYIDNQSSFSAVLSSFRSHDVGSIIKEILQSKAAAKPLTVSIDTTVGFINDKQVEKVLNDLKNEINAGKVNLVIHRSIHKFDTLGSDKLTGGYVQLYSCHQPFIKEFASEAEKEAGKIDSYCKYGFVHFQQCCRENLDRYRIKAFNNAAYVYKSIAPIFKAAKTKGSLPFTLIERVNNHASHYLGFKVDNEEEFRKFTNEISESGFLLSRRMGFGFSHTTLMDLFHETSSTTRLNATRMAFGLEDNKRLDLLTKSINKFVINLMRPKQTVAFAAHK